MDSHMQAKVINADSWAIGVPVRLALGRFDRAASNER
jgi:hypothetical protein